MANVKGTGMTVGSAPIVDGKGNALQQFRQIIVNLIDSVSLLGTSTWGTPTGSGSRASFNANYTTPVSNPPTQTEVQAMETQIVTVQKALAQLIKDLQTAGVIG